MIRRPPRSTLFPYTSSSDLKEARVAVEIERNFPKDTILQLYLNQINLGAGAHRVEAARSEEHTSELQSRFDLVCRLLLEKKKYSTNLSLTVGESTVSAMTWC